MRSYKRVIAGGTVILYAGMMLLGQSLHELLGCQHEHEHLAATHAGTVTETGASVSQPVNGLDSDHDPDTCPICQFHAQGQMIASVNGGELWQTVTTVAQVSIPLIFEVRALGPHGPRPPPCV